MRFDLRIKLRMINCIETTKVFNANKTIPYIFNDGGRAAAGYKGITRDCVVRAIAIATDTAYDDVYSKINALAGKSVARTGVPKDVAKAYMKSLGWL